MKLHSVIQTAEEIRAGDAGVPDPEELCRKHDVILLYYPMGVGRTACKGFILKQSERVAITVNSDLSLPMRRIIMFHELSHYFLHIRTGLTEVVHDFSVCDAANRSEYEANLLTAELSIPDTAVLDDLSEGMDFYMIAERLETLPELLDFKLQLMREKGYPIPEFSIHATGSFLKQADDAAFADVG